MLYTLSYTTECSTGVFWVKTFGILGSNLWPHTTTKVEFHFGYNPLAGKASLEPSSISSWSCVSFFISFFLFFFSLFIYFLSVRVANVKVLLVLGPTTASDMQVEKKNQKVKSSRKCLNLSCQTYQQCSLKAMSTGRHS